MWAFLFRILPLLNLLSKRIPFLPLEFFAGCTKLTFELYLSNAQCLNGPSHQ